MKLTKLTDDCYLEIIKNFEHNYHTLYNCLLVNRLFCRITVPLLWADPLYNVSKHSINIISIYLSYLNENEKYQLTSNTYQVDLSCIFQKTLFEYAKFLETYSSCKIKNVISLWYQYTQDISKPSLEIPTFMTIQSMLFRSCKRIKKLNILAEDNSSFSLIPSSWFNSSELRECEFKFVVPNIQNTNVYNYINLISIRNKRIQIIHIITYNEDIPPNCREPFLNLISAQTELKELVLKYYSITTSSFMPLMRREMLQAKSQSLRKLILQGIKFDKDNLANLVPNLEVLSIKHSFGNPFGEDENNLQNLQRLELIDNTLELNRIILKTKCKSLKFFIINEKELSNEIKEEIIFLLSQNYPNITTLCYVTNYLMFSSTLEKFHSLCQLQIGEFAYKKYGVS
ncbi:2384_t:CDS:1 [Cetraspora pellucida]|uniref:2384_t:CDS:1 n=1 Tax=Cetraspora pellucida TaxID=1433469 RepID=A0A9N8YZY2_9GLOM|nr:2384_t:CDS:1 [Cetraspora pellucida]